MNYLRTTPFLVVTLLLCIPLTGCLVMGYSTRGGLYIWPGSIILTLIAFALYYLTRRR
jgi:hypothetical protein